MFNDILKRDFSQDMISELEQMNVDQLENKLKDILAVPIDISKEISNIFVLFGILAESLQGAEHAPCFKSFEVGAGDVIGCRRLFP